ncbi:MAG: hypothetical protein JXR40_14675 [Pontiellaceae bacterium]|nr:hypothetical protein [Pontiellaceae bacterium]
MKALSLTLAAGLLLGVSAFAQEYTIDPEFGKGTFIQLAVGTNDWLYALSDSGDVVVFKEDGTKESTIKTGLKNAMAVAIARDNSICVFSNITETKKVKSGARMVDVEVSIGVEYTAYDGDGKKQKTTQLDKLKSVQAAHFVGGKIVIADLTDKAIVVLDPETGKELERIKKGLRLCCGIFDFCEGPDNTIAVSNLGAFKLQQFSLDGKKVMEFGKRGRELDDFHGCCNPVSAAYLPSGEILTVEKEPTRLKIYSATGTNARVIEGIDNLVEDCSFIPSAVDSRGVIYLASATKNCIVRCTPKKEPNP